MVRMSDINVFALAQINAWSGGVLRRKWDNEMTLRRWAPAAWGRGRSEDLPKKKTAVRREWTKDDVRTLKALAKQKQVSRRLQRR